MVFYDGSTRTFGYNAANDITSYTDENQSGRANTFDVLGRRTGTAITRAAGVVGTTAQSFQFDGLSRITFARDTVGSANADVGIAYDSTSRVLEEQQTYGGNTCYITHNSYTSDPATGVTFPQGRQLTLGYDLLYRKNSIKETSGGASIATWQFFGDRRTATVTLGNGLVCSFMNNAQTRSAVQSGLSTPGWGSISTDQLGYDGAGRLAGKRYFNGSSVLVGFTAAYDKSSNKLFERPLHAESRASLYDSYDSLDRLVDYQRGTLASGGGSLSSYIGLPGTNQQQAYNLDALGNWSTTTITPEGGSASVQSRTHNRLNQVTAYGVSPTSTPVYYDQGNNSGTPPQKGNGNIIDDGARTNAYDAFNRLSTVARKSDGLTIGQYVYDALGRRIQKTVSNGGVTGTVPNGTTRFLCDGQRVIEEVVSSATTMHYVWGQYIDELVQLKTYAPAGRQPLAAASYYLLNDLLYRSTALTDNTGVVVEAYDTDAYGNAIVFSGPGTDGTWFTDDDAQAAFSACRFLFTGAAYDAETAMYFLRMRPYNPSLGRFITRDLIDYLNGVNLYWYCKGKPLTFVDPLGLDGFNPFEGIGNLLGGAVDLGGHFIEGVGQIANDIGETTVGVLGVGLDIAHTVFGGVANTVLSVPEGLLNIAKAFSGDKYVKLPPNIVPDLVKNYAPFGFTPTGEPGITVYKDRTYFTFDHCPPICIEGHFRTAQIEVISGGRDLRKAVASFNRAVDLASSLCICLPLGAHFSISGARMSSSWTHRRT